MRERTYRRNIEDVFGPVFKAVQDCAANIAELCLPRPVLPLPVHEPCCSKHFNYDGKWNLVRGVVCEVGVCVGVCGGVWVCVYVEVYCATVHKFNLYT